MDLPWIDQASKSELNQASKSELNDIIRFYLKLPELKWYT